MKLLILFMLVGISFGAKARFDNYKVYRIDIDSEEILEVLQELEQYTTDYIFWESPNKVRHRADIVVPPHKQSDFEQLVKRFSMKVYKSVDNLQSLIDNEQGPVTYLPKKFGWTNFFPLEKMYEWMDEVATLHPNEVTVFSIGKSYEGRDIKGLKISYKTGNKGIFIESNIHAREWITSASATWIANELLTSKDPAVRDLAENIDWYFIPVLNPDGFEYTHTENRLWRKTRQPHTKSCYGADPNRNFGYKWMTGGSYSFPCSDSYAGPTELSEPETKALVEFYKTIEKDIVAYIDFHSFSQLLMYPYGTEVAGRIFNEQEHIEVGKAMQKKLAERFGTQYQFGNIVETIYAASGGSIDWVKGVANTPFVFVYEMRDTGKYGFILPPSQIIPNAQETLDSIIEMVHQLRIRKYLN